jgi:hypothetical protein
MVGMENGLCDGLIGEHSPFLVIAAEKLISRCPFSSDVSINQLGFGASNIVDSSATSLRYTSKQRRATIEARRPPE